MAGHPLIQEHLAALTRLLPSPAVDELADGLTETWQQHLAHGLTPTDAARAAIAEFGTPDQITRAFVAHAPGRRTALLLLATGPPVGILWGASLITAKAWTWQLPAAALALYGTALLTVVATLIIAATSHHSYHRTRFGPVAASGLLILDITMLATVWLIAPTLAWPMAVAIPASLARIALTLRALPLALTP